MARATFLAFFGTYRGHHEPHESPASMTGPLLLLAVLAALVGLINIPTEALHPYGFAAWTMFSLEYFEGHPAHFNAMLAGGSTLLALLAIGGGWAIYRTYRAPADDPTNRLGVVSTVLQRKYFLDDLYSGVIMTTIRDRIAPAMYWINDHVLDRLVYLTGVATKRLGDATYRTVDQKGIDGVVNGAGMGANWTGGLIKFAQSGNVQFYAGAMFFGVLLFAVLFAVAA